MQSIINYIDKIGEIIYYIIPKSLIPITTSMENENIYIHARGGQLGGDPSFLTDAYGGKKARKTV